MSQIIDIAFEEEVAEFDVDFSGTGKDGEVGGYYIPSGSGGVLNFTPSRTDMPEVPPVELPQGPQGKSAFDGAVEYGYTGTEEEFYSDFALFNERVQAAANAEKNSKASAEVSALSEKNAKASEEAAASYEKNAKASEEATSLSEKNAKKSEEATAVSEQNAKTSEEAAALSEQNAKTSEEEAAKSAGEAEQFAADAEKTLQEVKEVEGIVDQALTDTMAEKEAAEQARDDSAANAQAAAVSEQNAAQYAQAAETAIGRLTAFEIVPETGELMMYKSEGYTGPAFSINDNGELEVEIDV